MSSRPTPPNYKTRDWADYNAALQKRGSLAIWFDPDLDWMPPPSGKRIRQRSYGEAAIQACLTMKVLFDMVDIVAPSVRARCRPARRQASSKAFCN